MGRDIKLTDEQGEELDRLRFSASSATGPRNCLILFRSDSREKIASIAERLGVTPYTVVRIRRLYREGGVEALRPIKPSGREMLAGLARICGFSTATMPAVQAMPPDP